MALMPLLSMSLQVTWQSETVEIVAQTPSAAQKLFRHARIYDGNNSVLLSPRLSM
jgi:hypothetical protein